MPAARAQARKTSASVPAQTGILPPCDEENQNKTVNGQQRTKERKKKKERKKNRLFGFKSRS
jgi:hypothetical protein